MLKEQRTVFQQTYFTMALADCSHVENQVYTTCIDISAQDRTFPFNLLTIPEAKGNYTLLGIDFLEKRE